MLGSLAQLGEHLPYKQGVTGSSPVAPTTYGQVVQLVRMPACHAGGHGFEPRLGRQFFKKLGPFPFTRVRGSGKISTHGGYSQGV